MITPIGSERYSLSRDFKGVGAYLMVDMAHIAELVAAKVIPSPIPWANFVSSSTTKTFCGPRIVSGNTDNHIVLIDLRPKNISGRQFQNALEAVGITVNKNMIPFDPAKPSETSGVRIGLTSISQRGLKEAEVVRIAAIMNKVAAAPDDPAVLEFCKKETQALIAPFALYPADAFQD